MWGKEIENIKKYRISNTFNVRDKTDLQYKKIIVCPTKITVIIADLTVG